MELLVFSGSARSNALMALRQARAGDSLPRPNNMVESKEW